MREILVGAAFLGSLAAIGWLIWFIVDEHYTAPDWALRVQKILRIVLLTVIIIAMCGSCGALILKDFSP